MTNSERLTDVIKWAGMSINAFAKHIGYSNATVLYRTTNKNLPISAKTASKIEKKFTQVRKAWLLTGDGDMLSGQAKLYPLPSEQQDTIEEATEYGKSPTMLDKIINQNYEIMQQNTELIKQVSKLILIQEKQVEIIELMTKKNGSPNAASG